MTTTNTRRTTDWRDAAACRQEEPELFFPKGYEGPWQHVIEQAKTVCRRCPAIEQCLQFALTNSINDGIYGGLTTNERKSLRRTTRRRNLNPNKAAAKADQVRQPAKKRTLQTIVNDNTKPLPGGHLAWTGGQKPGFGGQVYTPKQICFAAARGHLPAGRLRAGCGIDACVLPAHLVEVPAVAECGTQSGYAKHLRERTEVCGPCRRAHADADARLRRTGTTKVLAS